MPKDEPAWVLLDKSNMSGLAKQLEFLLQGIGSNQRGLDPSVTIDESNGPVHIVDGSLIGPSVHIEGPSYIAGEVRHGAYVRSHSWICRGAVIGHATEVKHSLLLPGAKAPHFNYVGDSILGRDVNLGAGCKLSNLRNDGREIRIHNLGIDTGLRKFGAILGEGVQIGCNAVCNPGTVLGQGCNVWPNVTVSGGHPSGSVLRE
jgi:NDP-sugar pyrophosphorylase family protein|tara:strand:+ start:220 stop:828 length:609 start_codon:yes stop_codon:yes gene_type:complete